MVITMLVLLIYIVGKMIIIATIVAGTPLWAHEGLEAICLRYGKQGASALGLKLRIGQSMIYRVMLWAR